MALRRRAAGDRPPSCRLVTFAATDGVQLAGLLYEPSRRTTRAAVFLHGTGGASVFDSERTNLLAAEMLERRIAFLPFDNRGSQLMRRLRIAERRRRALGGMAYELIRESVHDIDGAARFLRRLGHRELFVIGHSTGANKVAVYDSRKERTPFRKYVLLAGGDDTGLLYEQLGARAFRAAVAKARERIRAGRGDHFVPLDHSSLPMSWRAFYDMANPDGDYNVFPFREVLREERISRRPLFRHIRAIRKPSLYVWGENDEFCYGDVPACARIVADYAGTNAEIVLMKDANHGFRGKERELGALIADWMLLSSRV